MTRVMPWLLPAPSDFRARLKAAERNDHELRALANFDLDAGQLDRLGRAILKQQSSIVPSLDLNVVRLGVVSSHTDTYILGALPAVGLRHGLFLDCVGVDFGQIAQSVLDPASPLVGKVDAVLLSLDAKALGLDRARLTDEAAIDAVDNAIAMARGLRDGVHQNLNSFCILTTIAPPADPLFGSLDAAVSGTVRSLIDQYNRRLASEVIGSGDGLVDIAFLAASIGLTNWHDARSWHHAKLPFALDYTPLYADHVARVISAARGKTRKCLVLDLDNTLWGGVIGDDGLEGIKLGNGNSTGEAHIELQKYVLELRERGIILAICSKNEDSNARLPFQQHPEMILKEDHIAAFIANWDDKANNLRVIARTLNIGTDALVFLDDNPAERAIVRQNLPEVAVPEVGDDPADYIAAIARAGWFEAVSFSDEDRRRAAYYQANAERQMAQTSVTNMVEYLQSLNMKAEISPFDAIGRSRIAQLINKSNQFNLTTRRYSESDVAAFEADRTKLTLQVRLSDKFGDNGMISVVIFDKGPEVWSCDTWLMSCRVLGRRVEEAVLAYVAKAAKSAGARTLRGFYVPTKKNALVATHYEKLGFQLVSRDDTGATVWDLDLASYRHPDLPIDVIAS